jgi:DNA (cytosine-5)-methyltransferase 1
MNQVAVLVRKKRQLTGMSQREFANFLDLPPSGERMVAGWESGEHQPSRQRLQAIKSINNNVPFPKSERKEGFRFIDLFAGIGGIRLPFQELGGNCVFSSEWDKFSQKTYAANFGEVPDGDITKIAASEIPSHDLLLAGFPCQAFSQAGLKRGFLDTRGTMFFEIQRILAFHRPSAFLLENVKQLKGHDKGRTLRTILSILRGEDAPAIPDDIPISAEARKSLSKKLDYDVSFKVLRANDFGVPQKRERVYIVGFDRKFHPKGTAEQVLQSLLTVENGPKLGAILEKLDKTSRAKYTISDKLWTGHQRRLKEHRDRGNGFGYSLFNAESAFCNTISARYYKDGSEILIDQSEFGDNPRKLTPRECARIQGFPDEFRLSQVSDAQCYRQFGNSVSVPVIRAIATRMGDLLSAKDTTAKQVA